MSPGTIFPTIPTKYNYSFQWGTESSTEGTTSGCLRGHISPFNPAWLSQDL